MNKKVLYIDMDGVVADFNRAIHDLCPGLHAGDYDGTRDRVHEICKENPEIFHRLEPIKDSIKYVTMLFDLFDLYFLSTPMWDVPTSFTGKRVWLGYYFGEKVIDRLILTRRKDLNVGNYLVDDRTTNGVELFRGQHIHFGTKEFPNWERVYSYLIQNK